MNTSNGVAFAGKNGTGSYRLAVGSWVSSVWDGSIGSLTSPLYRGGPSGVTRKEVSLPLFWLLMYFPHGLSRYSVDTLGSPWPVPALGFLCLEAH